MPAITGEESITYAGVTVGGSSDYLIDGPIFLEKEYTRAAVEFAVVITGSESGLQTAATALEDAFRKPRQDLVVTLGSTEWISLKQTTNTGLDAEPRILKVEDLPVQTGRSRRYRIRIEFGMPADNVSTSGRRYSSIALEYSGARRRKVTISGVWTAITGTAAYAGYVANIEAYVATCLSGIDATSVWEKLAEPEIKRNETDKVLEWTVTWQERIDPDAGQSATTSDDTVLVDQRIVVTRLKEGPGDSPSGFGGSGQFVGGSFLGGIGPGSGSRPTVVLEKGDGGAGSGLAPMRLIKLVVQFDAEVVKGTAPMTKYTSTVRAALFNRARDANDGGMMACVREEPHFDPSTGHLSATLEFWAVNATRILEQTITVQDSDDTFGEVAVAAWTGDPYSYYVYQGPAIKRRTVTERRRVVGEATAQDKAGAGMTPPDGFNKLVRISKHADETPLTLGIPDMNFRVTDVVVVTVGQFVRAIVGAGRSTGAPSQAGGTATGPTPNRPIEQSGG